jgi:hypothetical protein
LKPIPYEEYKDMTNEELIQLIRERMAKYINRWIPDEKIVHYGDFKFRW